MASHTYCLLSRSSNHCSQHFCNVCKYMFRMDWSNGHNNHCSNHYSKCMPSVITAPLCMKFQIDLAAQWCVCPTPHSPILANMILLIIILWQSTMRAQFFKVMMICMTMMIVQLATMLTMTAIVCVIPVIAMSPPPFSKVLVPMEIQSYSSMDWMDVSSITIHHRTRLGSYLIIQMTSLSLLNSRYHHHANWTWVHMSLSSCCS